jgi:hypothetical protein
LEAAAVACKAPVQFFQEPNIVKLPGIHSPGKPLPWGKWIACLESRLYLESGEEIIFIT